MSTKEIDTQATSTRPLIEQAVQAAARWWNTEGEVIAIHARGSDTSSFELPIEYLIDALTHIQNGAPIYRGEIGVDLELISIGEAIKHFRLPESSRAEIGPSESGTPKVIQIESIIPLTTGTNLLRASDIVYRINDKLIRDDLYTFDAMLNDSVGTEVVLEIYRNGEQMTVGIPVEDLELKKVRRFVRFAGFNLPRHYPRSATHVVLQLRKVFTCRMPKREAVFHGLAYGSEAAIQRS